MRKSILLAFCFIIFLTSYAFSQINGITNPVPGIPLTYTFDSGSIYVVPNWIATNGTVSNPTVSGTTYSVTVVWTSAGPGSLSFRNKISVVSTLNVTVCGATTPATSFTYAPDCYSFGGTTNATTITRTSSPPSGYTWYWQVNDPNGTSTTNSGASFYTSPGTTMYLRSYENANACWSSAIAAAIIPDRPSVGVVPFVCVSGSVQLTASLGNNGNELRWYDACPGGTLVATGSTFTTPVINVSKTYYVSSYNSTTGAESPRESVVVSVVSTATPVGSVSPSVICVSGNVTWSASGAGFRESYRWYNDPGNSTQVTPPNSVNTTTTMYVSIYNSLTGCEGPRQAVTVTVYNLPNPPTGSVSPSSICNSGNITWSASGANPNNEIYQWYDSPSGGTLLTPPTFVSSSATYYVSKKNTVVGCESSRTPVSVTVNSLPEPASGSVSPSSLCVSGSGVVTWSATGAGMNEVFRWYDAPTLGNQVTPPTTVSSSVTYYVCKFNNSTGCEGPRSAVSLTVYQNPSPPGYTDNSRFGEGTLLIRGTGTPVNGSYKWYDASNVLKATNLTYATPWISSSVTNYMTVKAVSVEGCESTATSINVNIYAIPVITAPQSYVVKGASVVLSAGAGYDTYSWKNSANSVVASTQTYSTSTPDKYTVTVTKNSLSATSTAFVLGTQLSGLNHNYIVTNAAQIAITDENILAAQPVENVAQSVAYFDGLGRPLQSVATQGSPSKQDLVQPVIYDNYGRESRKYLPFAAQSNGRYKINKQLVDSLTGAYIGLAAPFYATSSDKIADDARPFSETVFEASPLNRPLKDYGAGQAWAPTASGGNDKFILHNYLINSHSTASSATQEKIIAWTVSANLPVRVATSTGYIENGGYYASGQLVIKSTKDEAGNEVREYTDKLGRLVLKKVQAVVGTTNLNSTTDWALTYYIYDDLGNLRFVLPPELSKLIHNSVDTYVVTTTNLANWAFQYSYDGRKRMITKQVPGAGAVYMVYDNRDRLVLTQDALQRSASPYRWTFTKYDELNRPILTGIRDTTANLTQADMQNVVNTWYNAMATKTWRKYGETYVGSATGNVHGYSNKSYPVRTGAVSEIDGNKFLTVTYYDNYSFKSIWYGNYNYLNESLSEIANGVTYTQPSTENLRVIGQVTGTKTKVLDGGITGGVTGGYTWLKSVTYYDDKYRLVQTLADNYKGGLDRITNVYDFTGKVLETKSTHTEADVTWKDFKDVALVGNVMKSISGGSGAASAQFLPAGVDGWMEFTVSEVDNTRYIGFNDSNPDASQYNINYEFKLANNTLTVTENNGTAKATVSGILPGDVLRIARIGTTIKYYRNGVEIAVSGGTPSTSLLMVDFYVSSTVTTTATFVGVRTSFSTSTRTTTRRFEYDHAGRLLRTWYKLDAGSEILLASNEYNELGQLVDKKLHSTVAAATDAKQSVDYRYNIRGWLTNINESDITVGFNDASNAGEARDFFGMQLAYQNAITGISNNAQYNGNISAITWSDNQSLGTTKQNGFVYSYDAMNRLTLGTHKLSAAAGTWTAGQYEESITSYDQNGNIKALQRKGAGGVQIDNLTYYYGADSTLSNRLLYVQDNTAIAAYKAKGFSDGNTGTAIDYTYDGNGNMTRDLNKGIGSSTSDPTNLISYNYLNLPEKITTKGGLTLYNIYDAAGRKLSKVADFYYSQNQTDYVGEFVYEADVLKFINHEEGRIMVTGNKVIYTNHCDAVSADMTPVNVTLQTYTSNGENYIRATSTSNTSGTGIVPLGGTFTVAPGDIYRIRAKGYRTSDNVYLQVQAGTVVLNSPGARMPYGSNAESWSEQIITIPAGVTTLQVGLIWRTLSVGAVLTLNEFEISKLTTQSPEYQYSLKDHLGNVRVTFTTKDETVNETATLEDANLNVEQSQFLRIATAKRINATIFDHTNGASTGYSVRLNGSANEKYGIAKSLSVMPGDVINAEVYAKYADTNTANWTGAMSTLMSQIAANTAGVVVDGTLYSSSTSSFPAGFVGLQTPTDNGAPKAYLNWLIFDRNYGFITGGFKQITTAARETGTDVAHERLFNTSPITITQPGYVYIYLSNESTTQVEVFFDDFRVTQTKSPVIQQDDYYPFGLIFNSYSRENSTSNRYLYNGKELQDELGLNDYDYGARLYDPIIGRWKVQDGKAEYYFGNSPYVYALNQPTNAIDPDGNVVIFINGNHYSFGAPGASYWQTDQMQSSYKSYSFYGQHIWSGMERQARSFDGEVMNQLDDHKALYYDGSGGGWHPVNEYNRLSSNAGGRWALGYGAGEKDAKNIIANLARDKNGNIVETIKIITHSMGGAYGKGFVAALKTYIKTLPKEQQKQILISLVADFDPYQAGDLTADPDIKTKQFIHKNNKNVTGMGWLANEEEQGIDQKDVHTNTGSSTNHSISTFLNDISKLEEGKYTWDGNKFVKQN